MSNVINMLASDEGFRQFPYYCTEGKLTIGHGFNLDDVGISEAESLSILSVRVDKLIVDMSCRTDIGAVFDRLDEARKDAVINMAYQMGIAGVVKFRKMWAALDSQNWEEAARQALDSKWAKQTPSRAQRIATVIRTGTTEGYFK